MICTCRSHGEPCPHCQRRIDAAQDIDFDPYRDDSNRYERHLWSDR